MCLLGGEFMVVDRVVMADQQTDTNELYPYTFDDSSLRQYSSNWTGQNRVFIPPDWAPWGFLSAGAMTVLYGATLSRR